MPRIPNIYHFAFGFVPDFAGKPFSFVHYLSVLSCWKINRPAAMNLYYRHEPTGPWWEAAKPYLNLVRVDPPQEIFANPLVHAAHKTDVFRLLLLQELGGVYLDLDVLCLRPLAPFLDFPAVMGEEFETGLCNAVILAEKGSSFIARWLEGYRSFDASLWNSHSVLLPFDLAEEYPDEIVVLDHEAFFWPMHWQWHLKQFFGPNGSILSHNAYCVHLWEQASWDNHLKELDVQRIYSTQSEFNLLAREILEMPES